MSTAWLDASGLTRLSDPSTTRTVLILGCTAAETTLLASAGHRRDYRRVLCVNDDREDLEDASASARELALPIEASHSTELPAFGPFDLALVAPRFLHAQADPAAALRGVAALLERRAGVAVVGCDAAVGNVGIGHVRRLLSLLLQPDDPIPTQLQLALSLLQVLPPSNWLRRNLALQEAHQAKSIDLTDGATVYEKLIRPRPTPELTLFRFRSLLRDAGLRPAKLHRASDYAAHRLLAAGSAPRRLQQLARGLPWEWRTQLGELISGEILTHTLLVTPRGGGGGGGGGDGGDGGSDALEQQIGTLGAVDAPWASSPFPPPAPPEPEPEPEAEAEPEVEAGDELLAKAARTRSQYEALPFPPRRPSDESWRLMTSTFASLAEVSHHLYGGTLRRTFCRARAPFRALVAGGGTGDATVQLAAELSRLHAAHPKCGFNRSVVVHLDVSRASCALARARLAARGLLPGGSRSSSVRVRLVRGSLLQLRQLRLGKFDFINWVGVLHHVPDPAATLALVARHALRPSGGIGLMVYGSVGRVGVYETQAALRLLHAAGNASDGGEPMRRAARVADTFELLAALPAAHPLRRNGPIWASQEVRGQMGDSGVFDLLLSPVDAPYTAPLLREQAEAAGLRVSGWLHPALYEPRVWRQPCTGAFAPCAAAPPLPLLATRLDALPPRRAEEAAELMGGHARKHWAFLVPAWRTARPIAAEPTDPALAPCPLNLSIATLRAVGEYEGRPVSVRTELQGGAMTMQLPAMSSAVLRRLDCRRTLKEVRSTTLAELERVRSFFKEKEGNATTDARAFDAQWPKLYGELAGIGSLTMTDTGFRSDSLFE